MSTEKPELKSFPPITDAIAFVKDVDWADVRQRCRKGVNNCGIVIAITGEKLYDLGSWLMKV